MKSTLGRGGRRLDELSQCCGGGVGGFSLHFPLFQLMVDSLCQLKDLLFSIIWNVSTTKHNFSLSSCCKLLTGSTIVWITVTRFTDMSEVRKLAIRITPCFLALHSQHLTLLLFPLLSPNPPNLRCLVRPSHRRNSTQR